MGSGSARPLLAVPAIAATVTLSRWVTLRSDKSSAVREIIRSEVDKREGFSTSQEEKANLNSAEDERSRMTPLQEGNCHANREFVRAKKKRDDLTSRYQAVFSKGRAAEKRPDHPGRHR